MTNHTPGPWEITTAYGIAILANGSALCEMWQRGNDAQAMVDAKLIAAAPDLLESLAECLEIMNHGGTWTIEAQRKARAAIKKATGEE